MPLSIPRTIPTLAAVIPVLLTVVGGVWGVAEAWDHNAARVAAVEKSVSDNAAEQEKYRTRVELALSEQKKTLSDHGVSLAVVANDITNIKDVVNRIDKKLDKR